MYHIKSISVSVGTSYAAVFCIFSGNVRQSISFILQVTKLISMVVALK